MAAPVHSIANALSELETAAGVAPKKRRAARRRGKKGPRPLRLVLLGLTLLLLPFWVLVRGAVELASETGIGPWGAMLGAAGVTAGLLAIYGWVAARKLGARPGKWLPRFSLALVAGYCVYGLLFLSPRQFKAPAVRETYTALHPALRMALATMVLVDSDAVITDGARQPEDYAAMGLPQNQRSLHFEQADGFVYAVDLRTVGRPEWMNTGVSLYLRAVGLDVLRHHGTADHFHVYLKRTS